MKRYRVLGSEWDSRPYLLATEKPAGSAAEVEQWNVELTAKIKEGLLCEYGSDDAEAKLANFIDLGPKPFSILTFHNKFLEQIRRSFVVGGYFPTLTGSCSLAERILNHLILVVRDDYRETPEYKNVYRKDSFDDWEFAVHVLETWNVLVPEVATALRTLWTLRWRAIHFDPHTDQNDRDLALQTIRILQEAIEAQFGAWGRPWFIPDMPGESYIRKQAETNPFVRHVYLPNCRHVGPRHVLKQIEDEVVVEDAGDYDDRDVSDEEFRELRASFGRA